MIGIRWTGWDGSEWDLRTGNVRLAAEGVEGLNTFKFDSYTTDSAARDGQRFQGWRAGPRDMLLHILIGRGGLSELEYLALESAWWRTMRPGMYGRLTVTSPDGGSRSTALRFVDDGGHAYAIDPTRRKLTGYALNMIADDPYWYGPDPWSLVFREAGASVSFLGGKPVGTTYAWSGAKWLSTSTETSPNGTRTNLATFPSAKARSGETMLAPGGGTVSKAYLTSSGLAVDSDFYRMSVTSPATSAGYVGITTTSPAAAGATLTLSSYGRFSRSADTRLYVWYLDANGGTVTSALGPSITSTPNTWARYSFTGVVPAGTASVRYGPVMVNTTGQTGDTIDMAANLIEVGSVLGDWFSGSSGLGTPIVLGSSNTTDATTLTNPGDVDSYPVYTLQGPLTGFRIVNDGAVLSGSITVAADQRLVIDTSPIMQTAYLYKADGTYTNVIKQLTSYGFRAIRSGTDVKLSVKLNGTGSLTVSGEPRYFKAW